MSAVTVLPLEERAWKWILFSVYMGRETDTVGGDKLNLSLINSNWKLKKMKGEWEKIAYLLLIYCFVGLNNG